MKSKVGKNIEQFILNQFWIHADKQLLILILNGVMVSRSLKEDTEPFRHIIFNFNTYSMVGCSSASASTSR